MKKFFFFLLIMLPGSFLYLSKAQDIQFIDSGKHPVDGLIVSIEDFSNKKEKVFITNNKGMISLDELKPPVIIQTFHFAFQSIRDTLIVFENRTITLEANQVNLKEVSVTGNYGLTDHSLYNTEVISRETMDAQAAVSLQDLFVHQLNTRINIDPSTGSSISIQGIGGENIKILVDGVPVIGRLYNNINPSQLNLNNASRVEIIKGPASVLYGTNALGGVINIITDAGGKQPLKAGINSYYESTGQYNADVFTNVNFKKTSFSLTGGRNFFDGWSEHDTSRAKEWKPKEQYFGGLRVSQQLNSTRITYQTSYFNEKLIGKSATVRGWPYEAYAFDEYYKTLRFNNDVQINHLLNATHSLQITAAYSFYRYLHETYRKDLVSLTQNRIMCDTNIFGAGMARMVFTSDNSKIKLNYQGGIDVNVEYTTGQRIKNNRQEAGDYAAFASIQYKPFESLLISPSVRVAYNSSYAAPLVASLQTMYDINSDNTIRASYSRGFRSPSLKELYLKFDFDNNHNVLGNPLLRPENSNHYLASADLRRTIGNIVIQIQPSVFYNSINDKITLAAQGDRYTYINLLKYITGGAQLSANVKAGNLQLGSGISYTGIYNELENSVAAIPFTYSTEVNSSVQYSFTKTKTNLAVFWKYNGRRPEYILDENNTLKLFKGESYSMIDLSIVQPLLNNRLNVGAGLKNILNVTEIKNMQSAGAHQSTDNEMLTSMGRSVFLRIQFQISK